MPSAAATSADLSIQTSAPLGDAVLGVQEQHGTAPELRQSKHGVLADGPGVTGQQRCCPALWAQ